MEKPRFAIPIAILLALCLHSRAWAAGVITALTVSANPAQVNQDVTFSVKGTSGGCNEVILDYGDGQSFTLTGVSFQNGTNTTSPPHRYAVAKTYVVKASPGKGCTGSAAVSLAVTGSGGGGGGGAATAIPRAAHTEVRGPLAEMYSEPQIESVFPLSVISPGGGVIVQGQSFGKEPGKLLLRLHHEASLTSLGGLTWTSRAVSGTIDPNITGVPDQPAYLHVIRADGKRSNEVPVTFTARREIKMLPFVDFQCSTEDKGGLDQCNSHFGDWGPFSLFGIHGCTGFFDVWSGCWASGVDTFWTTLANGWQVGDIVLTQKIVGDTRAKVQAPPTIHQAGPGPVKITVWWDTGDYRIQYYYQVYVEGPAGTSYK